MFSTEEGRGNNKKIKGEKGTLKGDPHRVMVVIKWTTHSMKSITLIIILVVVVMCEKTVVNECSSNQECISKSLESFAPLANYGDWFCWKDRTCNPYPQLVMIYTNKASESDPLTSIVKPSQRDELYPVFKNGQEMCVTVMLDPSIVYTDRLWVDSSANSQESKDDDVTDHTQRLFRLKSLPLQVDIEQLRMCTSNNTRLRRNVEKTATEDVDVSYVRNTHVLHFDASNPEGTGCNSLGDNIIVDTLYDKQRQKYKGKGVVTQGHSDNALSSTVCFQVKVLGLPHVPIYVESMVRISKQSAEIAESDVTNDPLLRSLGFGNRDSSVVTTVTSSDSMAATVKWRERMLADVKDSSVKSLGKRSVVADRDYEYEGIDCEANSDYGGGHDYGFSEELTQQYHEYCLSKKDGYYGDSHHYYYYHPHVVCDFDLEFRGTAGICEGTGTLKGETSFHVFILILANAVGVGALIACYFDLRSGVLFL